MAYVEEYEMFADTGNDLHKKVARAIDKAARDVINEDPGATNHAERFVWACGVRTSPDKIISEAHKWMPAVLDNVTIAAAGDLAVDGDIQFVINSLVDQMAGV